MFKGNSSYFVSFKAKKNIYKFIMKNAYNSLSIFIVKSVLYFDEMLKL